MTSTVQESSHSVALEDAVKTIPCDIDLLAPIGLVMWSAIRMQHSIRDIYDTVRGYSSNDLLIKTTLGSAVEKLLKLTAQVPAGPLKEGIKEWCRDCGWPATEARNGVAHAISYTADEGRQAIGDFRSGCLQDYDVDKLIAVALQLEDASSKLHPVLTEARVFREKRPARQSSSAKTA